MRKVFLFISVIVLCLNANAQVSDTSTDLALIEKTINLYLDGQSTGDSVKIGKSYHSSWQLKYYRDNKFNIVTKPQYLVGYKKHDKPTNWSGRLVFVDITNDVAIAKVEISTWQLLFTDYFDLMKINQEWLIVNKISTRIPHKTVEATAPKAKS